MTSNIGEVLKGFKAQVKQEVNKLTTPRPQHPAGRQRPPQAYAQQQVPQQYGSQGVIYGGQSSQGQSAPAMFQQYPHQSGALQQPQFVPSQAQTPFNPQQQYFIHTSQPQSQIQTHPQTQQGVTSPQPQVTTQFQPQYQRQVSQQISPMRNQQYAPSTSHPPQIQGQFQTSYPQTMAQPTQQVYQQNAPGPLTHYSPANLSLQPQASSQSQAVFQPQQAFTAPGYTPLVHQSTAVSSPGQTPTQYQPQTPIQSTISSPARLSLHSSSPVYLQQNSTHTQHHQPVPPTGPPPAHLIQNPPPQQYKEEAQFQSQQFMTSSPIQSFNQLQVQSHSGSSHLPNLTNSQSHPQQPSSSAPVEQPSQPPEPHPIPSSLPICQDITQPHAQHQQCAYTIRSSQDFTSSQSLPYQQTTAQGQQGQPVRTTSASFLHRKSIPSPGQTPPISNTVQRQQSVSPSPAQQRNQTVAALPSQLQFRSQVHNSIRRKPHPAQSIPSPQPQMATQDSPQAMATITLEQKLLSPIARQTSPLSEPSAYQFLAQTQPVELEDHSGSLCRPDVLSQHERSSSTQQTPLTIDPPLIESDVKVLETVAPKPIRPPPQYEPSPLQQQSLPMKDPLYSSSQVSHLPVPVETLVSVPIHAEVLSQTKEQNSVSQPSGELMPLDPLQPLVLAQANTRLESISEETLQKPVNFIPQDQLQNEKLPVIDAEDTSIHTCPQYQAYALVSTSQSQVAVPETNGINLNRDANGRPKYQPYSPEHPNMQPEGYFPPITVSQGYPNTSSDQYQPFRVAPLVSQKALRGNLSNSGLQNTAKPQSPVLLTLGNQPQPSPYTSFTGSHQPRPPSQPCPEHLRNQTPPPESYFQQLRVQSEAQFQMQASPTPSIPHPGLKWTCSLGRKYTLTKYNTFYIPKHDIVPRTDLGAQELKWALCESCFLLHISQNPDLSLNFEPFISPDLAKTGNDENPIPTSRAHCQFGCFPMLKHVFYEECIKQSSLQPLVSMVQQFNALPPCPANEDLAGGEYYTSPAIPNSAFCTQCFDTQLKPSPFGAHFTMKLNGPGQRWQCDNGKDPGFTSRLLATHLNSIAPDFDAFSQELCKRLNFSHCTTGGKPMQAGPDGKVHAYGIEGLDIIVCLECFYDRVKFTPLEQSFIPKEFDPTASVMICDLASGISRFLFMVALEAKELRLWHSGLLTFNRIPRCEGIKGVEEETVQAQSIENEADATWYALSDFPTIETCPCCFHSIIIPLGGAHLFTPMTRQLHAGVVRTCNFSVGNGGITSSNPDDFPYTLYFRGFILRHLLEVGWESKQQDYAPFLSISKQLSECAPPCGSNIRGYKRPNGRRWYGRVETNTNENDCTIVMCQECYEISVKDTNLESIFGTDLTEAVYAGDNQNEKEGFCGPFSKRSKAVLKEAKEKNDWTIFARHWNMRQRVRDSTLPFIKALQAEFLTQNMQKMTAMSSALMIQGGAGISEAAGTDGMNHGNSIVGYGFDSAADVDAAMYKRNADNIKWGNASHITKIGMLEAQWKEVE